jgi:DNA helicase MCM8
MTTQHQTYGAGELSNRRPSGWDYYWPVNEYTQDDRRALLIRELAGFFCSPAGRLFLASARTRFSQIILSLDWTRLTTTSGIMDLNEAMSHAPTEALACLGAAAHTALFLPPSAPGHRPLPAAVEAPAKVRINLTNHQGSFVPVSAIRADQVGRLVTLRGTVSRTTPIRPLVTCMEFLCAKCGSTKEVEFPDGRFQPPTSCGVDGCRSRTLAPNKAAAKCVDWQRVQLQGLPRDEGRNSEGRVPRPIDVELLEDLVESAPPGEVITITGVVKVLQGEHSGKRFGGDAKRQCLFLPYVEAVSVVRGATPGSGVGGGDPSAANPSEPVIVAEPEGVSYLPPNMPGFTQLNLDFIKAFTSSCEGGDQLRQLVHSLAPGICGMEAEKAGLLLALFGGVRKFGDNDSSDSSRNGSVIGGVVGTTSTSKEKGVPVRGDIHVLLVGDPGLGKSQLLQAAAAAAPRGVYVCGSATSSAGLTVSVVKEGGDYCFEAGALVLADRGVCCVDEFDKATGEHAAMLGAMEQQEVAVAKAGLVASLPARTTVLAAANPVEGHYNRGKTLMQNMKMSPAMLSRFDLVFLLLDRPDAARDQLLTEHVMAAHSGIAARAHAAHAGLLLLNNNTSTTTGAPLLITNGAVAATGRQRPALSEYLKRRKPDDEPLPPQLLRKYIAYARQYVHPILTSEAATVIKSFYLGLRQQSAADPGAPPVTHRQLESLVRLAEARARVDLRERVTADDAEDAVEIMKESLAGMICSGPEMINFTSGTGNNNHGGKRGFQAERRRFLDALHRHCEAKNDKDVEVHELYTIADRIELAVTDTSGFIDQLNEVGDLLKRGGGRYSYNAGTLRLRKNTQEQQQQHQQFGTPFEERHNYNSTAGAGGAAAAGRSYQQQEHQRGAVAGKRGAQEPVYDDHDGGFDW